MEEEKEEIPKGFIEAVNFICNNAEVILDILNHLLKDYLLGKDIRSHLRSLKSKHKNVFTLIYDILSQNKKAMEWLSKIELEDDKRWVFSKIANYAILKKDFDAVWFEEFDFINPITSTEISYEYDEELQMLFIEVKLLSHGKEVLYFKEDIGYLLWLISDLTENALKGLKEYCNKPMRENIIKYMKEQMINIIKNSNEILKILNEMSGGEK